MANARPKVKPESATPTKQNTVPSGYMAAGRAAASNGSLAAAQAANPNGYVPTSYLRETQPTLPENGLVVPKGDSKITNIVNGKSGSGGGGSRVSYIGNDGSKKSGTVKVTPGTTPQYYTDLGNLYAQAHEDQIAANAAALEAALQRIQETREEQSAALSDQYAGSNRQLYRDYMEHRRVLPQQLAAMGYNGGLSESSLLRLGNSYEEGLNENERARIAQEAELGRTLAQQEYEARQKAAEADSTENQEYYGKRATLQQMIYSDAQQRAATMAAAGDFSEYKRLGFSDSEIAWLKRWFYKTYPQLA